MTRRAALAAAVVAATSPAVIGGAAEGQAEPPGTSCQEPYRQILVERTVGHYEDPRHVVLWPRHGVAYPERSTGSELDLTTRWRDEGIDTDGDGAADEITGELVGQDQLVSVRRGDGTVLLSMPGHALASMESATVGDLDADGRDELVVLARPVTGGGDRYFVVPGTTSVGDQVLDDVAIEVRGMGLMGVGDQGDGPGADLVVRAGNVADPTDPRHRQTLIASGDIAMDGGPGSTARIEPVVEPYEGFPMSVVDLGDPRPAIISGLPWDDADAASSIRGLVLNRSGDLTRFELSERFDSQGDDVNGWPPRFTHATAVLYAFPERALHLELVGNDRGGSIRAVWSIDDPCAQLPVAGVPEGEGQVPSRPPAPARPAQPTPASPSYTG